MISGSLTILTGFDSNKWLKTDFRKAETTTLNRSPFTREVQDAVCKVFCLKPEMVEKEQLLEIYESKEADLVAHLLNPEVKIMRMLYPVCQLHEKSRRVFTEILCEQVAKGKEITLLISDSIMLDTVLLAYKKGKLTEENLTIWFYKSCNAERVRVELDKETTGGIKLQPSGFFDEQEDILFKLCEIGENDTK